MSDDPTPFWQRKRLDRMSATEWEALCDGCGLCCLQKLEDEDTGAIHYTDVACRLLDRKTCRCGDYADRHRLVPDCVQLSPENLGAIRWLPKTCAYRLLAEDKPLPAWHYLVCGDRSEVHRRRISRAGRMRSEDDVPVEDWQDRVIFRSS